MENQSKFALTLCFTGALALSIGFAENLQSTKVSAEQNRVENSSVKEEFVPQENGTEFYFSNPLPLTLTEGSDIPTVITVEEQNRVEKMLKDMPTGLKVFVPQENGPGFYVSKTK